MSNEVSPSQSIYLDPYTTPPFHEHNNVYSNIYLSSRFNRLHAFFGNNTIVSGLDIVYYVISSTGVVTVRVSPGLAVVDLVGLQVPAPVTLNLAVDDYDPAGVVAVYLEYDAQERLVPTVATMKLVYVSPAGVVYPGIWRDVEGICFLGVFAFTTNPYTITYQVFRTALTVAGKTYPVRRYANFYDLPYQVVFENRQLSNGDLSRGYFELSRQPVVNTAVEVCNQSSGLKYSGTVVAARTTPDFVVDGIRVYITGQNLTNCFREGDLLQIKYLVGG